MVDIKIDEKIKKILPDFVLGYIKGEVNTKPSDEGLISDMKKLETEITENMKLEDIAKNKNIIAGREAYKALGKSPSKYRISSEALLRRIVQGKGLYYVNNIVDINNILSLKTCSSCGSYDLDKINFPIYFSVGEQGETYKGIGKDMINIENLPVFRDREGAFGSPTSDSERGMITEDSKNIVMCVFSFGGEEGVADELKKAEILLKEYGDLKNYETGIIR